MIMRENAKVKMAVRDRRKDYPTVYPKETVRSAGQNGTQDTHKCGGDEESINRGPEEALRRAAFRLHLSSTVAEFSKITVGNCYSFVACC